MSMTEAPAPRRRRRTGRHVDVVARLADAAVEELRVGGYDGLTVRNAARRAGVAPATAYTWFASKDHLVAEAFWRLLQQVPEARVDRRRTAASRVGAAIGDVARLVTDEPELAAAATTALLSPEPDVDALRRRIGAFVHDRIALALGDDGDPAVVGALDLVLSGAMLQAGMGVLRYGDLSARMAEVTELLVGGRR